MDESDSKIKVNSFFGRVDSIDKVANSALSKANMNFDIINNQKTLINSINISIEALETKVRDIANYIIIEKKIEKDAEEDAWDAKDYTPKERIEFVEQLNSQQYKAVESFFETMPKLSHTIDVVNPNTKKEGSVVLEGLSDFFV